MNGSAFLASLPGDTVEDLNATRDYLIFPERRKNLQGELLLVPNLRAVHDKIDENVFLVLHYRYDPYNIIAPCLIDQNGSAVDSVSCTLDGLRSIEESNIQIGLLIRKGTNKLYNQKLGLKHPYAWNVRLDMFVTKKGLWDSISEEKQNQLKYVQELIEDQFLVMFKHWNLEGVRRELEETTQTVCSGGGMPLAGSSTADVDINGSYPSNTSPKKRTMFRYYPLSLLGMRDIFKIELIPVRNAMTIYFNNVKRKCMRTVWYFPKNNPPKNFDPNTYTYKPSFPSSSRTDEDSNEWSEDEFSNNEESLDEEVSNNQSNIGYPVGVTSYSNFWTEEELKRIEDCIDTTGKTYVHLFSG